MGVRSYFAFDSSKRHGPDAFEFMMLEVFLKAQWCEPPATSFTELPGAPAVPEYRDRKVDHSIA